MEFAAGANNLFGAAATGSYHGSQPEHRMLVAHDKSGIRLFSRAAEAALYILLSEPLSLSDFVRFCADEKRRCIAEPATFTENDMWKYHLLKDASVDAFEGAVKVCSRYTHNREGERPLDCHAYNYLRVVQNQVSPGISVASFDPNGRESLGVDGGSGLNRVNSGSDMITRLSPADCIAYDRDARDSRDENEKDGDVVGRDHSLSHSHLPSPSPPGNEDGRKGGRERQTGTAFAEVPSAKMRRNCVRFGRSQQSTPVTSTVNIGLDAKGDLMSFADVTEWRVPDPGDLERLRDRVLKELKVPLGLCQADIAKATGLGASQICYLFTNSNSTNFTHKRRVEVFSVLSHLMKLYDAKEVCDDHFRAIRQKRIDSRKAHSLASPTNFTVTRVEAHAYTNPHTPSLTPTHPHCSTPMCLTPHAASDAEATMSSAARRRKSECDDDSDSRIKREKTLITPDILYPAPRPKRLKQA